MLTILLLSGVFAFYNSTLRARAEGSQITYEVRLARALLAQISEEIRHATDMVPGDGIGFRGEPTTLTIVRLRMPELYAYDEYDLLSDELPPAQMDLMRIRYELLWDDELEDEDGNPICHGLWRSEQKTFDPNPSFVMSDEAERDEDEDEEDGERLAGPEVFGELFAPEIKYLAFQYFDGMNWHDQWQVAGEDGGLDTGQAAAAGQATYQLPQAVKIVIGRIPVPPEEDEYGLGGYDEDEEELEEHHPDRFTIVVHLPQADASGIGTRQHGVADQLGREEGL
jgi:hypothetical protein